MHDAEYELVVVTAPEDWETYHAIRRVELFEARGLDGYDPNYPDEHVPSNFPLLLKRRGRGIATSRLDLLGDDVAAVRLVAVIRSEQRKGHGRNLNERVEAFARERGVTKLVVNAAVDAVPFYQRMGFNPEEWNPVEAANARIPVIQMAKHLT